MEVAIVTVGDELLAGETANTNATWLAGELSGRGVAVRRIVTLPDEVATIAATVNEYRAAYDAVVLTGGLGPTHDDLTMEAVAAAVGQPLVDRESVADHIAETHGYAADDLTEETTHLPRDARPLYNEVGVAPGCVVEGVYVLPGVPEEMKAMFGQVADEFSGSTRHVRTVEAAEPESHLLDRIESVRDRFGVKVGSYPGANVRLRLESGDESTVEEAADWLAEHVESPVK